ncbi:MAG: 6-phosphogluconolactonase [Deltaproteobacteria bacterium]|nr:6-phosphogluconolactonase [Deltaproteobacteria bacterium]
MDVRPEVYYYRKMHDLNTLAASILTRLADAAVRERGRFTFVLSGGGTPRSLYRLLTTPPFIEALPWARTHVFWGDERMVPRDHGDSNYAMALETLLSNAPLPQSNIHPIPVEAGDPERSAEAYEQELRRCFSRWSEKDGSPSAGESIEGFPVFDFMLLGMGKDGHTASLFPGSRMVDESKRWARPVADPGLPPFVPRVTLTLPVINQARCAAFLISGPDKSALADRILTDPTPSQEHYPAARVRPRGRLIWFIAGEQA